MSWRTSVVRRTGISEVELLLLLVKTGWAVLLLLPTTVLNGSSYFSMTNLMAEWVWGCIALLICLIVVLGAYRNNHIVTIIGLVLAAAWWAWISAMFYVSHQVPTGIVVYGFMSGFAMWRVFVRISGLYVPHNHNRP